MGCYIYDELLMGFLLIRFIITSLHMLKDHFRCAIIVILRSITYKVIIVNYYELTLPGY